MRYPEKELVSVPARKTYYEPAKPLLEKTDKQTSLEIQPDEGILDINDVLGRRVISTGLNHNVTIREENTITALEVISRFCSRPKMAHLSTSDDVSNRNY